MSCLKIVMQIYFQSISVPYGGEEWCNTGFWQETWMKRDHLEDQNIHEKMDLQ
jgi:hypothetical protein